MQNQCLRTLDDKLIIQLAFKILLMTYENLMLYVSLWFKMLIYKLCDNDAFMSPWLLEENMVPFQAV